MTKFALCVAWSAFAAAAALPVSPQWTKASPALPHQPHTVFVALPLRDAHKLTPAVYAVSDPLSPSYGRHWSHDEIAAAFAPPADHVQVVVDHLKLHGAMEVELLATGDIVRARLPAGGVNAAFGVTMHEFHHDDGRVVLRAGEAWTLPAHVAPHVDFVNGVSGLPMAPPKRHPTGTTRPASPKALTPYTAAGVILMSRGGPKVVATFNPVCSDGTIPTSDPMCPGGNTLQSVSWTATASYASMSPATVKGTAVPSCTIQNGKSVCTALFENIPQYTLYSFNLTLTFTDATGPSASDYDFHVVSTPAVIPQTIANQYSIPQSYVASNGTQAVVEFEDQYISLSDLDLFYSAMGLGVAPHINLIGFNNDSMPGGEADLDLQYVLGVGRGINTTVWNIYANSSVEIDDILTWAYAMGNATDPPLVNSISYGMTEDAVDKFQGQGYLQRSDVEFQKLALMGLTIVIADGDTGAGDLGAPPMSEPTCDVLHADWPSQSQFVTAVGSTYLSVNAEPICYQNMDCSDSPLGEVGVSMDNGLFWSTGGGMSNFSTRPSYQEAAVMAYLSNNATTHALPPASYFDNSGRAYPDAVSIGHNLMVALGGDIIPVDGTSASAPIFSGVISLLNDARISAGKSPLGFLNPLLYHLAANVPGAFYDVTVGANRCGSVDWTPYCCDFGYHATAGWDAMTGLGSPNFAVMKQAVLALP